MTAQRTANWIEHVWPEEGLARVPYWVYSDPRIYEREQELIFGGRSWSYVALECEVPDVGDFKRSFIGERPVVVVRDGDGAVNVVVNRCAHRGVQFCRQQRGNAKEFRCPYHEWCYDLKGRLIGVPFRRGVKRKGGMPDDFDPKDHGLQRLRVAVRNGVIFASFSDEVEAFEDYLGPKMIKWFDRVFDGRGLTLLGYSRQLIPANWKLMFENIKDPYHASLLHVFLVTFGLFRADNPSLVEMDETGRHGVLVSRKGEQKKTDDLSDMRRFQENLKLRDPRLLDPVREFPGDATVVMTTLWPNLIVQQQSNTLAMRQLVPRGPEAFELAWTFFGYETDDEAMTRRRLRQANLMGPSGLVSIDDSEVMQFSQEGISPYPEAAGVFEMGGRGREDMDHIVTESPIRAFYDYYRRTMGL
ncbi:MAG TPA: aromatic ring-hydroxylating dioxygenase subunit alpha [Kiloniellales bacterium]|nr:aromatic ring-hydroxylating dioxygenase subunit alpha [Kiloniellales bacterium]